MYYNTCQHCVGASEEIFPNSANKCWNFKHRNNNNILAECNIIRVFIINEMK